MLQQVTFETHPMAVSLLGVGAASQHFVFTVSLHFFGRFTMINVVDFWRQQS